MIELSLPWPPSVNRIWRTPRKGPLAGRVLLAADGREYRRTVAAISLVTLGGTPQIESRLSVVMRLSPPDRRKRDIDNSAKAVLDALMHAGVYRDDSQIDDLHIIRGALAVNAGSVTVEIREIGEAA